MSKRRFCAVCNAEISVERIEAEAQTRLCLTHAEAIRQYGGEFIRVGQFTSLGKTESLKKNYGDVTVSFQRNEEGLRRVIEDYDRREWEQKKKE